MDDEIKCEVPEGNSEIYETKAPRCESSSTDAQFESRQMVTVKEDDDVDLFTMKEEIDGDEVCSENDVLNASSSADVSGNDVPPHDNVLPKEEKILKILRAAHVSLAKEQENLLIEKPERCAECGKQFASRSKLKRHFFNLHCDERQTCVECGQKFSSASGLRRHNQINHQKVLFMCPYGGCNNNLGYKSSRARSEHIRLVHTNFRHVCSTCGKAFLRRSHMKRHSLTHWSVSSSHLATALSNASSSADVSESDVSPHDREDLKVFSEEKKVPERLITADVSLPKEQEKAVVKEPKQCTECGKQFPCNSKLQRHISSVHRDERDLTCEECGRKYNTLSGLKTHKRASHESQLFMCPYESCSDHPGYKSSRALTEHIQSVHARVRPHVCMTCGQGFFTEDRLKMHTSTHSSESASHAILQKISPDAGKYNSFATDLLSASSSADLSGTDVSTHDRVLSDEKKVSESHDTVDVKLEKTCEKSTMKVPHQCVKCGKQFASNFLLQKHFHNNHLEERLTCGECGRKFRRPYALRAHKQVVHGNHPFMCPYEGCDHPGFKTNEGLIFHIRSLHTNVRPYVCETCGRAFIYESALKKHGLTHSSEKTFQCKCGVKFRHHSSLHKHKQLCLLN
ncbi:hypothetical protein KIN20_025458 [Parelaphostrongylus tenuis]|uniref:C2H2-type domain-containing protein n=1 Tax=Parelaphostrongylus tenuis TaxID=148309 RepID=A0AAD5MV99_PARTN|nr:hypothetical protein KIN20_025458 [Parelaphostrongylus tenuis]